MSDPLHPTREESLDTLLTVLRDEAATTRRTAGIPGDRGIVVLCDLGVEAVGAPRRAWRVERGAFGKALHAINPSCAITAPIPLGEGEIEREGDRRGVITPGRRGDRIEWKSDDALARLDPAAIAARFPLVDRLLTFRNQLPVMKTILGSERGVRRLFESLVGDAANRRVLRAKLGYPEGSGFDAEALVTGAHGAIVAGVVRRFEALEVEPGETYLDRLMREVLDAALAGADDEPITAARRGCQALFLQLLHPAWENEGAAAGALGRMIERVDTALSGWLDVILHHPQVCAMELSLRALDRLAGETTFDLLQCSRAELLDPPPSLRRAISLLGPRVICAIHVVDPRREAEVEALRAWISRAAALEAVFLADAPVDLVRDLGDSVTEAWAALSAPELAGRFALFPQRRRARLPYSGWARAVRQLNYEEDLAGRETACLGASVAAFLAPAVAASSAGPGPWIGPHPVPGSDTAIFEPCRDSPVPIDVLAIFPAPTRGDDDHRCSLGLIDLHVMFELGFGAIMAPSALLLRLPDGRFAKPTALFSLAALLDRVASRSAP
jgi:hypothetical protein